MTRKNGHLLTHLGKGNGDQVQWLAMRHRGGWIVTAGWEQLVSTELQEATHVPILQKKSPYTRWKCQELLRRFSTLLAAGAAGHGLAPRLLALLFGPPARLRHRVLPLVAAQGHRFPAHVPGTALRSLSASRSRSLSPSPHLLGQVSTNVPAR